MYEWSQHKKCILEYFVKATSIRLCGDKTDVLLILLHPIQPPLCKLYLITWDHNYVLKKEKTPAEWRKETQQMYAPKPRCSRGESLYTCHRGAHLFWVSWLPQAWEQQVSWLQVLRPAWEQTGHHLHFCLQSGICIDFTQCTDTANLCTLYRGLTAHRPYLNWK